jgi:hypothetical protein
MCGRAKFDQFERELIEDVKKYGCYDDAAKKHLVAYWGRELVESRELIRHTINYAEQRYAGDYISCYSKPQQ